MDTDLTACGDYGVEWATNLQADITTYRDELGRRVQQVVEITEDNTVKNTVTGLTLRDGPVHFTQTTTYDPATNLRQKIYINGVSVLVTREGYPTLIDTGPLVIDGRPGHPRLPRPAPRARAARRLVRHVAGAAGLLRDPRVGTAW